MLNIVKAPEQVSVPYEITLLSNMKSLSSTLPKVSVPYEITLLSNYFQYIFSLYKVSVPYEITLLSNSVITTHVAEVFQYLMKLHYSQTAKRIKEN